ncbi:hypothetical protein Ahia01_001191300 [Argonauta hians]
MSGEAFVARLRRLGYPRADDLSVPFFDRQLGSNDEATRAFVSWFCRCLGEQHVVDNSHLRRFEDLVKSDSKEILEGASLTKALSDLQNQKEKALAEAALLDEELELCLKRKQMLMQSKDPLEQQSSVTRNRISKIHQLTYLAQEEFFKAEQACHQDAHRMNKVVPHLVETVRSVCDQVRPAQDSNSSGGVSTNYLCHLSYHDHHQAEHSCSVQIDSFFRKHLIQDPDGDSAMVVGQKEDPVKSRYDLLGYNTPDDHLIHGLSQDMCDTLNKEITRIRSIYPNSTESLIAAKIQQETTRASLRATHLILSALRDSNLNWISQARLKGDSHQQRSAVSSVFGEQVVSLIESNTCHQGNTLLARCGDLNMARLHYRMSVLDQILEPVLYQKARYQFLKACSTVELTSQHQLHYLLTAVYMALDSYRADSTTRQALLARYCEVEDTALPSYQNKFLKSVKTVLTTPGVDSTGNLDTTTSHLLYVDDAKVKGFAAALQTNVASIAADYCVLGQQRQLKLHNMKTVLEKSIDRLSPQPSFATTTTTTIPAIPVEVDNTLTDLREHLAKLHKELEAVTMDFKNRKGCCKEDSLLEEERKLFVYFHVDQSRLEQCVGTLESCLEANRIVQ